MVIYGNMDHTSREEDRNPSVIRGKMLAVQALLNPQIEAIQSFYGDWVSSEAPIDG